MTIETIDRETYAKCARLVERAVKTLMALPDLEARFQALKGSSIWSEVKSEYPDIRTKARFTPTARDCSNVLPVLAWLSWLESQEGAAHEFKVIWAHALGASYTKIGWIMGRHKNTIMR